MKNKQDNENMQGCNEIDKKPTNEPAKKLHGHCSMRMVMDDKKLKSIQLKNATGSASDSLFELQKLTSTQDTEIACEIFDRAVAAMPTTHDSSHKCNVVLQSLDDANPKDSIEAKLSMQEAVLYAQGMEYMARAGRTELYEHNEFYIKNAIKLLRLRNETIETMIKYRRGGEQQITVHHLNVNDGGKAIVGNVNIGGSENKKSDEVIP